MGSCEFLNVAHAALVEEFQRPRLAQGIMIPGLPLLEALKAASPWAEGATEEELKQEMAEQGTDLTPPSRTASEPRQSEEEIAAQNDRALAQLSSKIGSIGGFFRG